MKHNHFFFAILLASVSVPCSFAQELRLRTDNIDEIVATEALYLSGIDKDHRVDW